MAESSGAAPPTLYHWAGGDVAFVRLVGCFYDRVERDELISPLFPGGVSGAHREHVAAWWQEVFGGPTRYTDDLGGYTRMVDKHRGLGITGTRLAMGNSQPGADVVAQAPVPRWGWGVASPYLG